VSAVGAFDVPGPDESPQKFRILFYTALGGREEFGFLPTAYTQPAAAPRTRPPARGGGRQRRPCVLGFTCANEYSAGSNACGEGETRREV
jgi:hypothetical protein